MMMTESTTEAIARMTAENDEAVRRNARAQAEAQARYNAQRIAFDVAMAQALALNTAVLQVAAMEAGAQKRDMGNPISAAMGSFRPPWSYPSKGG
jgi:hypothetical protein